jgi:phosphoribosyl-AMP cyclohydrolase
MRITKIANTDKSGEPYFTPDEISKIDKKLPFIVFDWAKNLIMHVLQKAQEHNVNVVYMNTKNTLHGSNTEEKVEYFYEKLPEMLGFKKEKIKLRNRPEIFWAYHFGISASNILHFIRLAQKQFALAEIPPKYQGAILAIVGRKSFYTLDEMRKVYEIVSKKNKPKHIPRFYYDWSRTWSGAQRFMEDTRNGKPDKVVIQKIPSELQNILIQDEVLRKFWSFIMNHSTHFGADSLGFALVNMYNKNIWVINEIQTDTINYYIQERNKHWGKRKEQAEKTEMSWETTRDMLVANNRSNWIPVLEGNEAMKQYVISNPRTINELCDNSQDINQGLEKQRETMANIPNDVIENLRRNLANCDFTFKILLTG